MFITSKKYLKDLTTTYKCAWTMDIEKKKPGVSIGYLFIFYFFNAACDANKKDT